MAQNILNIDDKLHGFTVTNVRRIEEIGGNLVEMIHDKTGAKLVWADNSAENKLFSVGFKTLPEDNTGVFHILEHSVLCGSEKYPVKEPFVELLKTSMNTFLNAMTYPDKTVYPVSSRVTQDYLNLMEVYLDAVFNPNILNNPDIFYQEGWHIDTTEEEPAFKGVVFNEMKGAMSDVDQLAERSMMKMLFPDSCYGYNSGGDPDAIVDLSYEKFIDTYTRYYHPTNSYFYLDGNIPVDETLSRIDACISAFDRHSTSPRIVTQQAVIDRKTIKYAAAGEDDKSLVVAGRILGSWEERDKMFALSILLEQLADSNESPVKRAVLSTGLADDLEIYVSDGVYQPYLMIIFRGVSEANKDAVTLLQTLCDAVDQAVSDGIPHRDFEASINQLEFRLREYPEPQALYRLNAAYASWLYGGDPALHLATDEAIANLRKMVDNNELEAIAKDFIADKSKYSTLCLVPDSELAAEEAKAESIFVKSSVRSMSSEQRAALERMNSNLLKWQQTPNSEEDLAKIPTLSLSDIDPVPEFVTTEIMSAGESEVIFHPENSNGIVYINVYFPLTNLPIEKLPAATLITDLYKDLPTKKHNVLALQNEIRMHVGGISFSTEVLAKDGDIKNCTPCIVARAAVLEDKFQHAEELMVEILTETVFEDKTLIKELITQIDEDGKRAAVGSGHRLAASVARTQWSARNAASDAFNGYGFMKYMHVMSKASEEKLDEFTDFAVNTIKTVINKQNAKISVTATSYADISGLTDLLPNGEKMPDSSEYKATLPAKLGIQLPSAVSFVGTSYDMTSDSYTMNGSMAVASSIVGLSYLWNEIRVQGGAYGASMNSGRTGNIVCYTYRDPSPGRSLEKFKLIPDFLSAFASTDDTDIEGAIISSIASTDPLLSPGSKGKAADELYFSGYSYDDKLRMRREMLDATSEKIAEQRYALDHMAEKCSICVIGPKETLVAIPDLEIMEL